MWPLSSGTCSLAKKAVVSLVLVFMSLANTKNLFTTKKVGVSNLNYALSLNLVPSRPEAELLLPRAREPVVVRISDHYPANILLTDLTPTRSF